MLDRILRGVERNDIFLQLYGICPGGVVAAYRCNRQADGDSPEAEFHRITSQRFTGCGNTSFGGSRPTLGRSAASRASEASGPSEREGGEPAAAACQAITPHTIVKAAGRPASSW